jgi:hypothetical protein
MPGFDFPNNNKQIFQGTPEESAAMHAATTQQQAGMPVTTQMGLVSETDCFKAICELGDAKYYLKHLIQEVIKKTGHDGFNDLPESVKREANEDMVKMRVAMQRVHFEQLIIINDVCKRFNVIHPSYPHPDEELKEGKQLYWDWYSDIHFKVHGRRPNVEGRGTKDMSFEELEKKHAAADEEAALQRTEESKRFQESSE